MWCWTSCWGQKTESTTLTRQNKFAKFNLSFSSYWQTMWLWTLHQFPNILTPKPTPDRIMHTIWTIRFQLRSDESMWEDQYTPSSCAFNYPECLHLCTCPLQKGGDSVLGSPVMGPLVWAPVGTALSLCQPPPSNHALYSSQNLLHDTTHLF